MDPCLERKGINSLFLGLDFRGKYKWPNSKSKENQDLIEKTKYSQQSQLYEGAYTPGRAACAACNSRCPRRGWLTPAADLHAAAEPCCLWSSLVHPWSGSWRSGSGWIQQWQSAALVSGSACMQVSNSLMRPQQKRWETKWSHARSRMGFTGGGGLCFQLWLRQGKPAGWKSNECLKDSWVPGSKTQVIFSYTVLRAASQYCPLDI